MARARAKANYYPRWRGVNSNGPLPSPFPAKSSRPTLSTFWGRLVSRYEKLAELEAFFSQTFHWVMPVSVPQLREQLLPLIGQSTTGFPFPMMRAKLITVGAKNAFDAYQQFDSHKSMQPRELVRKFVSSEADAYLTSHLLALETAIKTKGKTLKVSGKSRAARTLRIGVEDANATVARRVFQALYGKDKRLLDNTLYNLILESPKVVLHEHYRGCSPMPMVRSWFIEQHHPRAYSDNETLQEYCRTDRLFTPEGEGPLYERDLNRFRLKNDNLVSPAIHSSETAYLGAYMYTLKSALENVRYFEYRLNPLSSCVKDPFEFARAIQQGIDDAKAFYHKSTGKQIDGNLIFSADRQPKPGVKVEKSQDEPLDPRVKLAMKVLEVAIQARQQGIRVTGFDIQGDEANYAITDFAPVAQALRKYNAYVVKQGQPELRIGATLHAGETPKSGLISHPKKPLSGVESIVKSVELFWDKNTPVRIGHGIRLVDVLGTPYGNQLLADFRAKGIGFEQCPKSNVQTGAVSYYGKLPTVQLARPVSKGGSGLLVSVSTDNRTTCKTNSCNELVKLTRHLGARQGDRRRFQINGMKTAFVFQPAQKRQMLAEMMNEYRQLESRPEYRKVMTQEHTPEEFTKLMGTVLP